jgi:predicted RNA-binding Zn ribbon-like protein
MTAFLFVGESLCLDFVNTELAVGGRRDDLLTGFEALVAWSQAAGTIDAAGATDIRARTSRSAAERAMKDALLLRTTLRAMAERITSSRLGVSPEILDRINDVLGRRAGHLAILRTRAGYETRFLRRTSEPSDLLVPVAESAASLLSSGDLAHVRQCQNPECILYFCDTTRNHRRRWCSMTACGNRAKVAAHYQRTRRAREADAAKG